MDQPGLSLAEQRVLRRDRAELEELRALGLDCLEHAPERTVRFASMAARLEARRQFGVEFLRACRGFDDLSSPVEDARPTMVDDVIAVEWRLRAAA